MNTRNPSLTAVACRCTVCACPEKAPQGDPICMWCDLALRGHRLGAHRGALRTTA